VRTRTVAVVLLAAAACGGAASTRRTDDVAARARSTRAHGVANIERADYAGSDACKGCHRAIYDTWSASPMHRMTRLPEHSTREGAGDAVRAPFDGRELRFKSDVARLEQHGAEHFVRVGSKLYLVTKVIGGHYREDFAGVPVSAPGEAPSEHHDEQILPVSFILRTGELRYKGYSVMLRERPGLRVGPLWNQTCIFCHNTAPYLSSLLGELAGSSAKRYQGVVVDALLPDARRWRYEVTDRVALDAALASELHALGVDANAHGSRGRARLVETVDATRARFDASHLLEIGIGCESCHGGSRAHASAPSSIKPSFVPRAPFLRVAPEPTRADAVNHACARCHQVLFSQYPFTWEGGRRHQNAGGSNINSGEGRDFLLGGCSRAMSCAACHDPHAKDGTARLREIDSVQGNAVCVGCHKELGGDDAFRGHAHHDPRGEAGVCIRCHMPKKNMTLDARLGRYHRIGSPSDPARVLADRPLECALCHAGKSAESIVRTMETWWKKAYDREALRSLYGDLDAPPLVATLARGKPHEQAVALAVLGERRERGVNNAVTRMVARSLVHAYPLVREYARRALESILGRACAIDLAEDTARIEASARRCLADAGVAISDEPWPTEKPSGDVDSGED
jgi:predicted CXXCH cytochrome family protein